MKTLIRFFRGRLFFLLALFALCSIMPAWSQSSGNENFPAGSSQGTSEMSEGLTGIDFPNITFSASAPQDGHQIAFSIELLLLLDSDSCTEHHAPLHLFPALFDRAGLHKAGLVIAAGSADRRSERDCPVHGDFLHAANLPEALHRSVQTAL